MHDLVNVEGCRFILFGGFSQYSQASAYWMTLSMDSEGLLVEWKSVHSPLTPSFPSFLSGSQMVKLMDAQGHVGLLVYGGMNSQTGAIDRSRNTWWAEIQNSNLNPKGQNNLEWSDYTFLSQNAPQPVWGGSSAAVSEGRAVFFGGNRAHNPSLTFPLYFGSGSNCIEFTPTPNARTFLSGETYIYEHGQMQSGSTGMWYLVPTNGFPHPAARFTHGMATLSDTTVVLFGGIGTSSDRKTSQLLNETWIFDVTSMKWSTLPRRPNDAHPSPRSGLTVTRYRNRGVALFGGAEIGRFSNVLNDTWVLLPWDADQRDGSAAWRWTRKDVGRAPPARFYHQMSWLGGENGAVLFGGSTPGSLGIAFGDTWILHANGSWSNVTLQCSRAPSDPPAARKYHTMSFAGLGRAVLFGGKLEDKLYSSESYLFSINSDLVPRWTPISVNYNPPAGAEGVMTYFPDPSSTGNSGWLLHYGGQERVAEIIYSDLFELYIGCPEGTYQDAKGFCTQCEIGTFQNTSGNSEKCIPCPGDSSTNYQGAKSDIYCTECRSDFCGANSTCTLMSGHKALCKCVKNMYGQQCEKKCTCKNQANCDDGIDGTGKCYCSFSYLLGPQDCSVPVMAILIAAVKTQMNVWTLQTFLSIVAM